MNKRIGLAFASGMLVSASICGGALAADMAVKAPYYKAAPAVVYSWTGWYAGVNGGGAWGNSTGALNAFTTTPPGSDFTAAVTAGGTPRNLGAKHEGGFGGGQIGYNWQSGNWVYGLETDIQGAAIGSTSTTTFLGGGGINPSVSTGRDHIDWFGTFRGRVGIAANQVLFYGTGGLAYGGVRSSATNVFTPSTTGNFSGSTSDTRVGWAAGAGIEWAFAPSWTLKGEYLHIDLGSSNVTIVDPVNFPTASATYRFRHDIDSVRLGVNYRFNWTGPVMAKY